ncbi:MAG: thioredoxin family protein [Gemmatimonadales bacterium]|nr:thioredoxin family protein [Gemmatimonadales bacterium]MDZ4389553.1 thioredoxin family protein [Gemmatimonadales bacterium]
MFDHRFAHAALLLAVGLLTATPGAATAQAAADHSAHAKSAHVKEDFTEARFKALQKQGALILVDVWASWCPTCAKQQDVLTKFRADNPGIPLHTLTVNFDTQKEWVKFFRAPRQSTMILFRGTEQLWFAVAETRSAKINEQLLLAANSK